MRAVVLVGGFGTRLRPLTEAIPKQMIPVLDRPMLEHVLGRLPASGIDEVVLALGYRPDAFLEAYPDGVCAGVRLHYAVESEPLDTAGAVRFAADEAGFDETLVVLNGDVLTDIDVGRLVEFHTQVGAGATIALTPVDDPSRFGVVPTDDDGRVLGFIEKPPPGEAPTNWINAGIYVLEADVVAAIPTGRRVSIERETFPALAEQGRLYAKGFDDYWLDTGTPASLIDAHVDLLSGRRGAVGPSVAPTALVDPGARLESSVVMADAQVGAGASLVRSVVMTGARVGARVRLVDTIVAPGASVGDGSELVDSVVGYGVEVAEATRCTSARIPEPT